MEVYGGAGDKPATMSRWLTTSMGTTTDWVTMDAKAPPAKLVMAEAAEGVGAQRAAGSAAHTLVFSSVVR